MTNIFKPFLTRAAVSAVLVLSVSSCGQTISKDYVLPDICKEFDSTPITPLSAPGPNDPSNPKTVFEEPGQIKVMHGFGSAKLSSGNRIIKVEQGAAVPNYANHATVFLNGWDLSYLGDDQHVLAVGSLITEINFDQRRGTLNWIAAGLLRDDDFEEGYSFTYHYTVIAWNDASIKLQVNNGRPDGFCSPDTDMPDQSFVAFNNGTTALSGFSIFRNENNFQPITVLPRGFGFAWYDGDHHLLQLAYNLDHTEAFVEQGKPYNNNKDHVHTAGDLLTPIFAALPDAASHADSNFVSWDTFAIMKDNSSKRDYIFSEIISSFGGGDLGLIQPPFSILPKDHGAGTLAGTPTSEDIVIENVPFSYAIPMLTGWELNYTTDDQHVKELGIWIDDWNFTPGPTGGTLRYKLTSVLGDNDGFPNHTARHKITILGIKPLGVKAGVTQQSP